MLDCLGSQLVLLLHRDVHSQGLKGRLRVPGTLLALRRGVRVERHRGVILGTGDERQVSGRSHADATIANREHSAAPAPSLADSISVF